MSDHGGNGNGGDHQRVLVRGLEVMATVGVPDGERAAPQRLLIDLEVVPSRAFAELADDIENAVDYHALSLRLRQVAECGQRHLIETLAVDLADAVLADEKVAAVRVRIRKFILPDTEFVGVELSRSRALSGKGLDDE